jgi:hypothetical protein
MMELSQDFFVNGSKQIDNFKLLVNICRMATLLKTSPIKKWTTDFVANKPEIHLCSVSRWWMRGRNGSNLVQLDVMLGQGKN